MDVLDPFLVVEQDKYHVATGPHHHSHEDDIIEYMQDYINCADLSPRIHNNTVSKIYYPSNISLTFYISCIQRNNQVYQYLEGPAQAQGRTNDPGSSDFELCPHGITGTDGDGLKDTHQGCGAKGYSSGNSMKIYGKAT